jgi:hypothetical protein
MKLHAFPASSIDDEEQAASHSGFFFCMEEATDIQRIEGRVDRKAVMDSVARREVTTLLLGIEPLPSIHCIMTFKSIPRQRPQHTHDQQYGGSVFFVSVHGPMLCNARGDVATVCSVHVTCFLTVTREGKPHHEK